MASDLREQVDYRTIYVYENQKWFMVAGYCSRLVCYVELIVKVFNTGACLSSALYIIFLSLCLQIFVVIVYNSQILFYYFIRILFFCAFRGIFKNNFAWTTPKGKYVQSRNDIKLPSSQWQWVRTTLSA